MKVSDFTIFSITIAALVLLPAPVASSLSGAMGDMAIGYCGQPGGYHPGYTESPSSYMEDASAGNPVSREQYPARQQILELAMKSLENRFDGDSHRFEVTPRWIPASLAGLPREAILEVVPKSTIERFTNFEVTYKAGNSRQQSQVQLQVEMEQLLPVMRDRMTAGTVITVDDIETGWISVTRDRGQLATHPSEIEGKTLRRTLAMGEPVRKADITTEYVIEAGEAVTLIFLNHGTRIDLTAVARQDGAMNDDIRLYSNETRRTYLGKVTGPGEVLWKRTL